MRCRGCGQKKVPPSGGTLYRTEPGRALLFRLYQREAELVELRGDDLRQRGFAHARRAPKDERRHVARFEELAEHTVLTHEVLLPDIFVYRAGAQSFG